MKKAIKHGNDARRHLFEGLHILARAASVTLGPAGRTVLIEGKDRAPRITKDGVTVVRSIEFKNRYANMGAQILKDASEKTMRRAGDGTTTACVLAHAIAREGLKYVAFGANPIQLKRGIDAAVEAAVEHIEVSALKVEANQIESVALQSSNGDEKIAILIGRAIKRVGASGVITTNEWAGAGLELEIKEGMRLERGYLSERFVTDKETMHATLRSPYVLLVDGKLTSFHHIEHVMKEVLAASGSLFVMADDVEQLALTTLVLNNVKGVLPCVAVRAPGAGRYRRDMLEDLAVFTGATVISESMGAELKEMDIEHLGRASIVTVSKDETVLVGGAGLKEDVSAHVRQIGAYVHVVEDKFDRDKACERIARLSGGMAEILVGGTSEAEIKERKDRVDDALHATTAAIEEGIVPGGGVALLRATEALRKLRLNDNEQQIGVDIVRRALRSPLEQIASNAGADGSYVASRVLADRFYSWGYDARKLDYCDMLESGIFDPAKVQRMALQNAASVASLFLTTEAAISLLR